VYASAFISGNVSNGFFVQELNICFPVKRDGHIYFFTR
jgi:hypothetical protein